MRQVEDEVMIVAVVQANLKPYASWIHVDAIDGYRPYRTGRHHAMLIECSHERLGDGPRVFRSVRFRREH
jgi:hypothetical protein